MANVYAVKTGNWSDTTVWNTGALPTSADDVYSNNFTVTIDQNVTVLTIRNTSASGISAGGGFVVNGTGYTITCTTTITFTISTAAPLLTISGSGTNTFNISINVSPGNLGQNYVFVTSTGTINWIGNLIGSTANGLGTLRITSAVTFNMVGDIYSTSGTNFTEVVRITGANYVFNLTGNIGISNGSIGGSGIAFVVIAAIGTINITGNIVSHPTADSNCISIGAISTINITGTITGNAGRTALSLTNASYVKVVGILISNGSFAVSSTSGTALNIFSGPFICSSTGIVPFSVTRMHYIITSGSYFEFRDSSTNGALPPAPNAPATRLVSPDTAADAPAASNVRFGVTYALGTQTGTLRVPSPNSVAFGVLTDNTTGTAVLTPQAVWNYATSSLTTAGSIGERLKNASTVDTTGDQLAALL